MSITRRRLVASIAAAAIWPISAFRNSLAQTTARFSHEYPRRYVGSLQHLPPDRPIEGILFYGQSNCGAPPYPVTSFLDARYPDTVVTFRGAEIYGSIYHPAGSYEDFVPLTNPHTALFVQTPTALYGQFLRERQKERSGLQFLHTTWFGGQAISAFLPRTPAYGSIVNIARDFGTIAGNYQRAGRITALVWIQGEAISPNYGQNLQRLIPDLTADLQSATRQQRAPAWLVAQTNNRSGDSRFNQVPLDQYETAVALDQVFLIGPMYQLPLLPEPGAIHPDERGKLIFGELIALVHHIVCVEGRRFEPLHPHEVRGVGNRIVARFAVPASPLQWDTDWIQPVENYGFVVKDGAEEVDIRSIRITASDTIEITVAKPLPPDGCRLLYAMGPTKPANGWAGTRGQLFSPTSSPSLFHQSGFAIPDTVRHYCVRFAAPILPGR